MLPYQLISKPHKHIPSNPFNPENINPQTLKFIPLTHKPMLNLNHVISVINKKNILHELIFYFLIKFSKNSINRASGSRRFTTARV